MSAELSPVSARFFSRRSGAACRGIATGPLSSALAALVARGDNPGVLWPACNVVQLPSHACIRGGVRTRRNSTSGEQWSGFACNRTSRCSSWKRVGRRSSHRKDCGRRIDYGRQHLLFLVTSHHITNVIMFYGRRLQNKRDVAVVDRTSWNILSTSNNSARCSTRGHHGIFRP